MMIEAVLKVDLLPANFGVLYLRIGALMIDC